MINVAYMDIAGPKFLIQALAQGSGPKFTRRERACCHVSSPRRGCACKQQRTPLASLVQFILLKSQNRMARKCKRCTYIYVKRAGNLGVREGEEWLPVVVSGVPERHT